MSKHILSVAPMLDKPLQALDDSYTVHRLYEADDQDAFLRDTGADINVVATTGFDGASAELMDAPHPGGLGGTYSGNPLACVAALGAIDAITAPGFLARAEAVGERMRSHLDIAYLWARRQIRLETAHPEILPKDDVVANWRIAKGEIADHCFQVAVHAMKACGTSNTGMDGPISRSLRDLSMGFVQGFTPERGRLEAAEYLVAGREGAQFGTADAVGKEPR